ncbi:hypothetical protein RhiirA4_469916 [Rhizophagus irregularis]|uniref:Uncharacterized protein n=1 Tax=Rhizophagus irregularis TaxID=588596 RepID=A0A2I1H0J3_9GLOM|nr:hypothetical protein RhiirA4_469916 [Rhizophagus irregularis]
MANMMLKKSWGDDGNDALVSDFFNETEDWGNDNDSGWNNLEDVEDKTKEFDLAKYQNQPDDYYDKYGPNGSLTKAIAENASSGLESNIINPYTYQITEKIKELKE